MMYSVYILISIKDHKLYIGQTNNMRRRFLEHCRGEVRSTAMRRPLKLIYYESFLTRIEAERREEWLKGGCGRKELKSFLELTLRRFGYRYL